MAWNFKSLKISRRNALFSLIMCFFLVCVGQLVNVQLIDGPKAAAQAKALRSSNYNILARRGDILDADGKTLATSVQRYNVGVNQKLINTYTVYEIDSYDSKGNPRYKLDSNGKRIVKDYGPMAAAKALAPILGQDPAVLGGKMVAEKPSTFYYIAQNISPETWRSIRELNIRGIEPEPIMKRIYPNANTGGNIIGFTDKYGSGIAGLEQTQEKMLSGQDGEGSVEIGRDGRIIPGADNTVKNAVAGHSVQTSIKLDLQDYCQKQMDQATAQMGAQWSAAVVEEISTGRILALCDTRTVNPSLPGESEEKDRGSRAVSTVYEPGSTLKLVTVAAALEEKKVTPETTFPVPSVMTMPNRQEFHDSSSHPLWHLSVAGILAKSSNVGTIQIGDRLRDSLRYEYMNKFGFGKKTGIELPGESRGLLAKPEKWDGRQRYTTMFGQGMAGSLLQTNSAVATIANGGMHVAPHVIDSYLDPEGKIIKPEREKSKRVVSPEVASEVMRMMEGVVSKDGTSPDAAIEGYRVGGKTGTTQILDPKGVQIGTVGSFSGVIPMDNPKVAISVVVYRPSASIYGSVVAVPAFKAIATRTMTVLQVPPNDSSANLYPLGG